MVWHQRFGEDCSQYYLSIDDSGETWGTESQVFEGSQIVVSQIKLSGGNEPIFSGLSQNQVNLLAGIEKWSNPQIGEFNKRSRIRDIKSVTFDCQPQFTATIV
jgi:hypothetical protein